jgi:hypothetical protein
MGNTGLISALLFEPRKAFAEIAERPRYWVPLLLLVLGTVGLSVWYQASVDAQWLADLQLRNSPFARQLTEEQIATQVQAAGRNVGLRIGATAVGTAIVLPLIMLISSVYLLLAGKITNVQRSFRQWFALTCWTGLPSLLSIIPAAVTLLTATTRQIDPGDMQPLSLNALLMHRAMGEPGYTLFTSLQLPTLLSLYLATVGVKVWSGRSWLFSVVFAGLPTVLIFGIWAFLSLGRA